jgi:hypothetical protein
VVAAGVEEVDALVDDHKHLLAPSSTHAHTDTAPRSINTRNVVMIDSDSEYAESEDDVNDEEEEFVSIAVAVKRAYDIAVKQYVFMGF